MNKKVFIGIIICLLVIVGVVIYFVINNGNKTESNKNSNNANEILNNNTNNEDSNAIVVYFSVAGEVYNVGDVEIGNTAIMASYIKEYLNCDSFEIVPVKPYTTVYNDLIKVAQDEQKNNARPEIKDKIENFDKYDTVFIGYPIWWGDLPPIVYTFIESYNFEGKTVIPFNTHEGSGSAGTYNTFKSKLTKANVNTDGLALKGSTSRTDKGKDETINWLKKLGY